MSIATAAHLVEAAVLHFHGELDASSTSSARTAFSQVGVARRVIVDLTEVSFIDSAGLGAVIGGIRGIRAVGGETTICCRNNHIRHVLRTTGVDRIVEVTNSVAAAPAARP